MTSSRAAVLTMAAVLGCAFGVSVQDLRAQATPREDGAAPARETGPEDGAEDGSDERRAERWWEQRAPDPEALRSDPDAFEELLAEHGVLLDLEGGTVAVRGATLYDVASLEHPIEYFVVTERGKTYEAVFMIKALPSVIDACLRATGLQPGNPTLSELKDPQPSDEEIMSGRVSPFEVVRATGPLLTVDVAWTGDDGRSHRRSLESLLLDLRDDEPLDEFGWIFTGSRQGKMRQGRDLVDAFMADVHGNVVAVWLDGLGTDLLERNDPGALENIPYTINPETMPPRGTRVTLVLKPTGRRIAGSEDGHPVDVPDTLHATSRDPPQGDPDSRQDDEVGSGPATGGVDDHGPDHGSADGG